MVNKLMEKEIEALVEEERSKNPERYEGNNYYYYLIVIEKLYELIEKYDAEYLSFENEIINDVILDYDFDGFWNFISKRYSDEVYELIKEDERYFEGIDNSDDEDFKDTWNDIYCSSMETIAMEKMGLAIDAFHKLKLDEKLYFLLLLEEYEIKPTEELYKMFCNSQEAFKREITISKLSFAW